MLKAITSVLPDALKSLFGIIDKAIPDREKADALKLELFQIVQGSKASHWLPANAFTLVMVSNYAMIMALALAGRSVPEWALWVFGAWVLGPLINTMSKDTIGRLSDIIKSWKKEKQDGLN